MATAEDVIRTIRSDLSITDGRAAWDWYWQGSWGYVDGFSTPYCAVGLSYALSRAGVACEGFPRAVAIDRRDGFTREVEPANLRAGDVVGFDWDYDRRGDHVGLFVEWITRGETFRTLEYNSTQPCGYHIRQLYQVTIGVRPEYDGAPAPTLDVDGACGPATVTEWQRQMGTPADGCISDQLAAHDRYRRNVWAVEHGPGHDGSSLVWAVQRRIGAHRDGLWGEDTTRCLQAWLRDAGYYAGGIDGDFGQHSVKALQRSLNDKRWE